VAVVLHSAPCGRLPGLLLRPWCSQDSPVLVDIYHDPVMRQTARNPIVTEQDACRWLEVQQEGWVSGMRLSFAVLACESVNAPGRVLGNVVLKGYVAGNDSAEVGYWTVAAARNRGVASQAVQALTSWAFEGFGPQGLRRIELLHQQDNLASCRVAEKAGYVLTGTLPADPPAFPADGHLHTRYSPGLIPVVHVVRNPALTVSRKLTNDPASGPRLAPLPYCPDPGRRPSRRWSPAAGQERRGTRAAAPGLGSGQPEAGLTTAGNPVHRSSGGRCPASLKLISPAANPGR